MRPTVSIFLDFNLPNATTWFYFSFLLAISLFFKFGRLVSMRNWDVITIFLLVPGLMVIQATRPSPVVATPHHAVLQIARTVGQGAGGTLPAGPGAVASAAELATTRDPALMPMYWVWLGYLWLMIGSAYLFCRCLYDLALVQRPALAPNLSFGGLAFLAVAMLSCLIAVAFRPTERETFAPLKVEEVKVPAKPVGPETATLALAREWIEPRWWLNRGSAVTCHLAVVVGLVLIGRRHFQDATAGMAAATFYLMLPYTGMFVGQVHHILPMAMVVWALVVYPWPVLAGFLLGLATGTAYFPALLLPIWIGFYWGRGVGRFVLAFVAAVSATMAAIGLMLWIDGSLEASLQAVRLDPAWQPWKVPHTESFWTGIHAAYRIPVFVAFVVFVLATAVWPWPKNLSQLLALSTAAIIGIQFWYADQGGVYVLWYLPLLVLLVFRPNVADRRPPEINPETDWLTRFRRAVVRTALRSPRAPEPVGPPE
ncbi:MAG: hypothetical protein L0Y71_09525 [Gemmataceae bacterium]|nr:hypothetical protein [Gemmataceae bacterium]